jgi:alkylation response protein AidB-like acyl-CoA dehydrogenase
MDHHRELIEQDIVSRLREYTAETERNGSLPPAVLDIIYQQRWFQLLVPAAFGGQETALPDAVKLFEALAWADANIGWCVNLGAGANMFAGYLDAVVAATIFNNPKTCCAGSGAVTGTARRADGGYILNGRWKYASGANHATHFTANAFLLDEDGNTLMEEGQAVFRSFIVPTGQVTNHRNWNAIGLKATSSNDFEISEIFVPDTHTFTLLQPSVFARGPLYKFPFAQLAVVDMACMATGIALHFIDLYTVLAQHKKPLHSDKLLHEHPVAKATLGSVEQRLAAARTAMYEELQALWDIYSQGLQANDKALLHFDATCRNAAQAAREVMNELYPLCGMSILDPSSALNKVWRDGMTASQHYLLSPLLS